MRIWRRYVVESWRFKRGVGWQRLGRSERLTFRRARRRVRDLDAIQLGRTALHRIRRAADR